jgi:hypothetical protein
MTGWGASRQACGDSSIPDIETILALKRDSLQIEIKAGAGARMVVTRVFERQGWLNYRCNCTKERSHRLREDGCLSRAYSRRRAHTTASLLSVICSIQSSLCTRLQGKIEDFRVSDAVARVVRARVAVALGGLG